MNEKEIDIKDLKNDLNNTTEDLVLETMEELLNQDEYDEICKCRNCLLDIASYALNRLPTKYISNPSEDLKTKIIEFENKVNMDVVRSVENAIKVISNNPRHN